MSVFNFDTFTTAIYKTQYGFFSLSSAAQLASLLLLAVLVLLYGERRARGQVDRPTSVRVALRFTGYAASRHGPRASGVGWCFSVPSWCRCCN